jgi:hypothetical protein
VVVEKAVSFRRPSLNGVCAGFVGIHGGAALVVLLETNRMEGYCRVEQSLQLRLQGDAGRWCDFRRRLYDNCGAP